MSRVAFSSSLQRSTSMPQNLLAAVVHKNSFGSLRRSGSVRIRRISDLRRSSDSGNGSGSSSDIDSSSSSGGMSSFMNRRASYELGRRASISEKDAGLWEWIDGVNDGGAVAGVMVLLQDFGRVHDLVICTSHIKNWHLDLVGI